MNSEELYKTATQYFNNGGKKRTLSEGYHKCKLISVEPRTSSNGVPTLATLYLIEETEDIVEIVYHFSVKSTEVAIEMITRDVYNLTGQLINQEFFKSPTDIINNLKQFLGFEWYIMESTNTKGYPVFYLQNREYQQPTNNYTSGFWSNEATPTNYNINQVQPIETAQPTQLNNQIQVPNNEVINLNNNATQQVDNRIYSDTVTPVNLEKELGDVNNGI